LLVANRCSQYFDLTPKRQRFADNHRIAAIVRPPVLVGVDDITVEGSCNDMRRELLVVSGTRHFQHLFVVPTHKTSTCSVAANTWRSCRDGHNPQVCCILGMVLSDGVRDRHIGEPLFRSPQEYWANNVTDGQRRSLWSPRCTSTECMLRCVQTHTESSSPSITIKNELERKIFCGQGPKGCK